MALRTPSFLLDGAIHFHRDDLQDARWGVDFELEIPTDLPSGVYAAWLRAGSDEDYLPFIVRPSRSSASSKIVVPMSTMTYLCYANYTDLGTQSISQHGLPR